MNVDHDDDVMPSSCRTRLPSYVEQETAQSTDDDDQQLPLLEEESVVIDRTSTEPLMPMEELLSMSQPAACPVAVSRYLNLQSSCLDISHSTSLMEHTMTCKVAQKVTSLFVKLLVPIKAPESLKQNRKISN